MAELFPYQMVGCRYLRSNKAALLFDDPGLGKTAQALSALSINDRAIVVCPASVKGVWEREVSMWTNHKPVVLAGRNSFRLPKQGEIIVLNPDILPNGVAGEKFPYRVILDEVHAFKSTSSLRSKRLKSLRYHALSNGGSVWGLTGTPILSRPDDLWGILAALGAEKQVYGTFDNFMRIFNGSRVEFKKFSKIMWGKPSYEAAEKLHKFALGRKREEVLPDLPRKTYEVFKVDVRGYTELLNLNEDQIEDMLGQPGNLAKLRALVCLEKARSATLYIDVLNESEPLVVFTSHVEAANHLANQFDTSPITGQTSINNRNLLVEDFQAGKTDIIIGTIGAMGVGLTLTRANRVVFISRDWTPALNLQAEDRVCRIGQKKPVLITDILCDDTTEHMVYNVLMRKQSIIDNSVEMAR